MYLNVFNEITLIKANYVNALKSESQLELEPATERPD